MTPDQARDLLDGTTIGPWAVGGAPDEPPAVVKRRSVNGGPLIVCDNIATDIRNEANAALIAAAPDLAAMIAGMREEWGVSCGGEKPGAWWASREEADQCAKRMGICIHYPLPIVVVRRYVTTPEEIS